jgi:hypothetical protein
MGKLFSRMTFEDACHQPVDGSSDSGDLLKNWAALSSLFQGLSDGSGAVRAVFPEAAVRRA